MSEYKRLTIKDSRKLSLLCDNCKAPKDGYTNECDGDCYAEMYARLEGLEDKLESGQLVELKYKKGDYVFFISWLSGNVCEGTVVGWQEDSGYCIVGEDDMISAYECFPTQEAAEARLKELQDKEDCP